MAGAHALPVQEYCDDSQFITLGPFSAAQLTTTEVMLWAPDRTVRIDHVYIWFQVPETTAPTMNLRLLRGIGPLGGVTGTDANIGAVVTADRRITVQENLGTGGTKGGANVRHKLDLTTDAATGVPTENLIEFTGGTSTEPTLQGFVAMDWETAAPTQLSELFVQIRYSSKIR